VKVFDVDIRPEGDIGNTENVETHAFWRRTADRVVDPKVELDVTDERSVSAMKREDRFVGAAVIDPRHEDEDDIAIEDGAPLCM